MITRLALICVAFSVPLAVAPLASQRNIDDSGKRITGRGHPKTSPFRSMRKTKDGLEVQVHDDTWYELLAIEKLETASLVRRTRTICGRKWFERITEDLPEVLEVLGVEADGDVDLRLRSVSDKKLVELANVEMTRDKRQRLLRANRQRDDEPDQPSELTLQRAKIDLAMLRKLLDERFAYRARRKVDLEKSIRTAERRLAQTEVDRTALAREVQAILREFGDGHSRMRGASKLIRPGFLPFLIAKTPDGVFAFEPDRSSALDPDHQYLASIDGVPIEKWLEQARKRVVQGSPQFIEHLAVRELRNLADMRIAMGIAPSRTVNVELRGPKGKTTKRLRVARRRPIYADWPRVTPHRVLDDGIGYLRIAEMSSEKAYLRGIDEAMKSFRDTKGLIIDVRGNGGGSRAALRTLFPYLMKSSDAPHVANIGAFRVPPDHDGEMPPTGFLANRFLFPLSWSGWNKRQQDSIRSARRRFKPSWKPPRGDFSTWHYFVLHRGLNTNAYHYDKPVVVLLDGGCFSATDIFLGALKGWRGVTLIGTASGGGSGRSLGYQLPHSGIQVRLSSMASFRPNGQLYEDRGIHPDIVVERIATDYLSKNTDTQLETALARFR